jgi:ParB-like chromosome segregation protein Spo0J
MSTDLRSAPNGATASINGSSPPTATNRESSGPRESAIRKVGAALERPDVPQFVVQNLDPHLVEPAPGNRPITLDDVKDDLLPSIEENDQCVPIIAYRHPEKPGWHIAADGNRRTLVQRIRNMPVKAIVLDEAPTAKRLILLRHHVNSNAKHHDKAQIGADMFAYRELTGASVTEIAAAFGCSQGYASKLLAAYEGRPELLQAIRDGLILPTAAPYYAALSPEKQLIAIDMGKGKKRDLQIKVARDLAGKKDRGQKPRRYEGDGITLIVKGSPGDKLRALHSTLGEMFKKADKEAPDMFEGILTSFLNSRRKPS